MANGSEELVDNNRHENTIGPNQECYLCDSVTENSPQPPDASPRRSFAEPCRFCLDDASRDKAFVDGGLLLFQVT